MTPPAAGLTPVRPSMSWPCDPAFVHKDCHSEQTECVLRPLSNSGLPPTIIMTLTLAPDETRLLVGFMAAAWLLEPGRPGRQRLEQAAWGKQAVGGCVGHRTDRSLSGSPSERPSALWNVLRPGKGPFAN